jgi:hypothetical protein
MSTAVVELLRSPTLWNVILILAGSGVAVGGIFGEGYDKGKFSTAKWWAVWSYVTRRGWVMLLLTALMVVASVWKYQHDFADATAKEAQLGEERDDWKKKAAARDASTQGKLDALKVENASLKSQMEAQGKDFVRKLLALKEQNDSLAGRAEALRKQLEELKKDSEGMVLATAMAGSTASASVLKARDDLQSEIKSSADVLSTAVTQYDDQLFHVVSDMREKYVVPMHLVINARGHADEDLPTLKNVRDECASPQEIEAVLKSPAAKGICPACACTCNLPSATAVTSSPDATLTTTPPAADP